MTPKHVGRIASLAMVFAVMEVVGMCASAAALSARVEAVDGLPRLVVNGKPTVPLVFYGTPRLGPTPLVVEATSEWQKFSATFVAPEDCVGAGGMHIRLGGAPGKVWIDDVRFYEGPESDGPIENMLQSTDFETGGAPLGKWSLFVKTEEGARASAVADETTSVSGKRSLRIDIENGGSAGWHVHLYQSGMTFRKGRTYTLSAWLKADRKHRCELDALHHGPPWTRYLNTQDSPFPKQVALAAKAGVHIHSFGIPMPWPRPGEEPNFAGADRVLDVVLANDPDALMVPRFGVMPPGWWLDEHPGTRMMYDDGPGRMVCVASPEWRQQAVEHLRALVRHLEERYGEHMLGYHPCGQNTGEWFYDESWSNRLNGFSEAMSVGFRDWVRRKYRGNLQRLRMAWRDDAITFDAVVVPTKQERLGAKMGLFRDPALERKMIDFYEYKQVAMVEPLEMFARVIKEETNRDRLVVLFYGYLFDMSPLPRGPQTSGHFALERMLECPDVDILCSPISYFDRGLDGSGPFMVPVESVQAHGKLWLNEDDTRTYLSSPESGYGRIDTPQRTFWVHQRNFGNIFTRRMACWYMDLPGLGWLNGQDIWDNIARLRRIYEAHLTDRPASTPEIAVIVDEKSMFYLASSNAVTNPLVARMRRSLYRIGAPFGMYLLSDLCAGRVPEAKLYVFLNPFAVTREERDAIHKVVRRDGKLSVWFYGAGLFGGGQPNAHSLTDLTGVEFGGQAKPVRGMLVASPREAVFAGFPDGFKFGVETALEPTFRLKSDSRTKVLATYEDTGEPGFVLKSGPRWRSAYIGTVTAPPRLLRNLAKEAGVFVY
ncbi:MAG: carbohydrate binding domain-containing protein, partial [Armatimonadota bacterium]